MTLTDPNRSAVREKLRPVFADDTLLEAFMAEFHASPSDRPVTESMLEVKLAQLEVRLTDKINAIQMHILAILLPFTVAVMAIAVGVAAAVT